MSFIISLPRLRENLRIFSEEPDKGRYASSWVIYDSMSHVYYEIGRVEFLILSLWHLGNKERIIEALETEHKKVISGQHFDEFFKFLVASDLLIHSRYKEALGKKKKPHWFFKSRMLFYHRINLLRPEKLLDTMHPYSEWMFKRSFHMIMIAMIVLGILGVVQNFSSYQTTFISFLNFQDIYLWFIALALVKVIHEFAHALTAKHYGCSVAAMGVAFIIFWPVLYTDTTNAWALNQKRKRIFISAAGVISEIYIAAICSLIWLFFPDGIVKTIAFILSSTAWITSLFINLNPFMKFDGYFILSDILKVKNLHSSASFYLSRYFDTIFLGKSTSEHLPHIKPTMRPKLAWFGLSVIIYRAVITLSIIWLIYTLLFKLLAIMLIIIYIIVSVLYPIYLKIKNVCGTKSVDLSRKKLIRSAAILSLLIGIFFYPWKGSIQFPALLHFKDTSVLYVDEDAIIKTLKVEQGDYVKKGDVLVILSSASLNYDIERIGHELSILKWKLRSSTLFEEDKELIQSNIKEIEEKQSEYDEALLRKEALTIKAPHNGVVYFPEFYLKENMAFKQEQPIISIVDNQKRIVTGYIEEGQMPYFDETIKGALFYPEDYSFRKIALDVKEFSHIGIKEMSQPYMASVYGGPIAAKEDEDGVLIPEKGVYLLTTEIGKEPSLSDEQQKALSPIIIKGTIYMESKPYSLAKTFFDFILSGFMKHSSF